MSDDQHQIPGFSSKLRELYLDAETADVHFVIGDERIPAHKIILSIGSDVFKAMFYGELKETGDIVIVDASTAAFKEFLQFFYLNEVELTEEIVPEVVNLGKKYDVKNCLSECESFLIGGLDEDTACSLYDIAILYDLRELKLNCKLYIAAYTEEVLHETNFKGCSRRVLSQILKLDRISCTESEVFNACIAWIKAETKEDVVTNEMLHTQLGDLLYEIRFGAMSIEEFGDLLSQHGDLFSSNEYKEIVRMIASEEYNSEIFKRKSRRVDRVRTRRGFAHFSLCNREIDSYNSATKKQRKLEALETCTFSTNQTVLLNGIQYADMKLVNGELSPIVKIVIFQRSDAGEFETVYEYSFSGKLEYPVLLKPGMKYTIQLHRKSTERVYNYEVNGYKTEVHIGSDLIIQFHDSDTGPITALKLRDVPEEFGV